MRVSAPVPLVMLLALAACDTDVGTEARPDVSSERVVMDAKAPVPAGARPRGAGALEAALAIRPQATPPLLARGKTIYEGFCLPCHGADGGGNGAVTAHGFPPPPPLSDARLRAEDAAHTVAVVTHGKGRMWPMAERVEAADRWAVAAYVEQLKREGSAP